ncbi:hypothetical protein AC579_2807 [Pseudocercospora musae]|uniref:Uncharacterized protein n=1 Tax=Pseudocercospora musae TaxID=113226 RepID=A0A139IL88_9PEZI|nr:hypothetical protein AC579_2807 [Pseudocercospora musae]
MGLIDKIRSRLETRRLEQRYARRDKRRTSVPNIQYVDGEYVLSDLSSTGRDLNPAANRARRRSLAPRPRRASLYGRDSIIPDCPQETAARPKARNRESVVLRYMSEPEEETCTYRRQSYRPPPRTRDSVVLRNMDYLPGEETRSKRQPRNRESIVLGNMLVEDTPSGRTRPPPRNRDSIVMRGMAEWTDF